MQFVVTGLDGGDDKALDRRLAARDDHLAMAGKMAEQGKWLYAVAILDDDDKMIGSVIVCEFDSEKVLREEWLDHEPYVVGNVWKKITISRGAVAPIFL